MPNLVSLTTDQMEVVVIQSTETFSITSRFSVSEFDSDPVCSTVFDLQNIKAQMRSAARISEPPAT